jgi:hypothetical protein
MRLCLSRLLILACLATSNGCLAKQLQRDGASSQEAISEIYTQQAMNNLIRARNNLPFVQLKYSALTVNDNDEISGAFAFTHAISDVTDLVTGALERTVGTTYAPAAAARRNRTMSFVADPETDQNFIYNQYIEFANTPGQFVVSDHPPTCPVHIHRRCGKKHYWVPEEAGQEFFNLVMNTAIKRGDAPAAPAAITVKIEAVTGEKKISPDENKKKDVWNAFVKFDKKIVPNGNATMVFNMDSGRTVKVDLYPHPDNVDSEGNPVAEGDPTDLMKIQWDKKKQDFGKADLVQRAVRIYSHDYPPEVVTPDPVLSRISSDLNQIRISVQGNRR